MKRTTGDTRIYRVFGKDIQLPLMRENSTTKEIILIEATLLFAHTGFAGMRMQELAKAIGMTASSLYNHYPSKISLWRAVLEHAERMFRLCLCHVQKRVQSAENLREAVSAFFYEIKTMENPFACCAFSMIRAERIFDQDARQIFNHSFLKGGAEFFEGWLNEFIKRRWCQLPDTKTVAYIMITLLLDQIIFNAQKLMGYEVPIDTGETVENLENILFNMLKPDGSDPVDYNHTDTI